MARRLFPEAEEVDEIHSGITFPKSSPDDDGLPYVVINMVSSLDGKASSSGKSGAIGSDDDRTAMRVLRSKVDAVISGSGTLRAEKVSLTSEGRRSPEPLAVIPSVSLDLNLDNLMDATPERTILLTTERSVEKNGDTIDGIANRMSIVKCKEDEDGNLDYRDALRTLKRDYGAGTVLIEGGPGLNHRVLSGGSRLVQEIFVTIAPKILAGPREDSNTIVEGPLISELETRLLTIHVSDEGEIFTRYELS